MLINYFICCDPDFFDISSDTHNEALRPGGEPRTRNLHIFPSLKSYGPVNEKEEKIGKWSSFNEGGQLMKTEEFVLPEKRPLIKTE